MIVAMRTIRFSPLVVAFILAWSPHVRAEGLPDLGESAQSGLSPQLEKKVGEDAMRDIRLREPNYVDDPEIYGYLNRVGHTLSAYVDDSSLVFEFFAIQDPTLNAFAMPGGYIGVHTGLIIASQTESELASVLAHEISHVTQRHLARMVERQSQGQLVAMLAMAAAILAARNNPDVAIGAVMAGQAGAIQNQLSYSRDFEREADRMGLRLLDKAGYDVRDMAAFFQRLQKFGRVYENNAPAYLRTHPLTTERISDMESRVEMRPYKQVPDSLEFTLVRAKLVAAQGSAQEAVAGFESRLKGGKFVSEPATRYGLARACLRARNFRAAENQVAELRRAKLASPMLDTLAAELRSRQDDFLGAVRILTEAHRRYPDSRAVAYALAEALLAAGMNEEATRFMADDLQSYPDDFRMHGLAAKGYGRQGQAFRQHWALAEAYAHQGLTQAAIEQLELAQKLPEGDFYERSQVDARLRQLKLMHMEDMKQRKP